MWLLGTVLEQIQILKIEDRAEETQAIDRAQKLSEKLRVSEMFDRRSICFTHWNFCLITKDKEHSR